MHQYKLISKKGEGTFSEVLKAQSIQTSKFVAIKCMKNHFSTIDRVHNLAEIQALKKLSPHDHIIKLYEILYDEPSGRLALVFELMDCNLYEHIKGRKHYLHPQKIKLYIFQLLKAIDHMHRNGIFHRDIKPENILLQGDHVKLADFGSCKNMQMDHPYTEYISTRWYRAPECLMTDGYYDYKMDLWGVGCVMFEVTALFPLFPGKNELDQVHKIHKILGTPNPEVLDRFKQRATHMEFNFPTEKGCGLEKYLQHAAPECIDLIRVLLTYDPEQRITAQQALRHEYFRELWDQDILYNKQLQPSYKPPKKNNGLSGDEDRSSKSLAENSDNDKNKNKQKPQIQQKNPNGNSINNINNVNNINNIQNINNISNINNIQNINNISNINNITNATKNAQNFNGPFIKSTEGVIFPPINAPKYKPQKKIPYDQKKALFSSLKKPLNQYNFNLKKNKKDSTIYAQEYILSGKKAQIGQINLGYQLQ